VFSASVAGQLVPCGCSPDQHGGLPRAAAYLRKLRQTEPDLLFVDAGDLLFETFARPPAQMLTQKQLKARTLAQGDVLLGAAARAVGVQLNNGRQIEARSVVLATGYVMPDIVQSTVHTVSSSWAIATTPQPQNIWKDAALIWENSKDYLYARTTRAGRIIIGGEDSEEDIEPELRDRLIPEKSRLLAQKLAALWPAANTEIEFRWSGTFDTTRDGLPLIGPVPGAKGIYAAYGYGGNGITFSFLAAQLIGDLIAGSTSPLLRDFALDRDGGAAIG